MILAIDTATRQVGIALALETEVLAEHNWRTENNHTRELAPAVERVLRRAGVTAADLRAIGVAIGPGSFTGLRIGLGFAKGLAIANNCALVGIPTLDIVASAQPEFSGALLAALQAGRERIAIAEYAWEDTRWRAQAEVEITTWEAVVATLDESVYVCGEIDETGRALLRGKAHFAPPALNVRRAGILTGLARARLATGAEDDAATLAPLYFHHPSVTPPQSTREPQTA